MDVLKNLLSGGFCFFLAVVFFLSAGAGAEEILIDGGSSTSEEVFIDGESSTSENIFIDGKSSTSEEIVIDNNRSKSDKSGFKEKITSLKSKFFKPLACCKH